MHSSEISELWRGEAEQTFGPLQERAGPRINSLTHQSFSGLTPPSRAICSATRSFPYKPGLLRSSATSERPEAPTSCRDR
jgi:hypothetical protein